MIEKEYFTKQEAQYKVGKKIQAKIELASIPRGTVGIVLKPTDTLVSLPIQWELPDRLNHPLVDWFSKIDYERFLLELT
jgi:hypothetical protein